MASFKGVIVVGVTIGAAVGVYYGLSKAFPVRVEKGDLPEAASADEVFTQTISESTPPPKPKEPPPTAPPTEIAEGEPPPISGTPPPTGAAPAEAPKPATPEPAPSQPAPSEPAPAPAETAKPTSQSSQQALLVPEPAPTPTPKAAPTPAPQPTPETTVPAPAPEKPAAPPPKPAPEKPAAAPKPTPAPPPATAAAPAPTPKKTTPPATEATARWWGDPKEQDPRKLNVSYAGQAAGQKGIALLFNGTFASAGVANWIKVTDANGKSAPGHWELGASPKMLVYKGIGPGRYTVTLSPDLKDAQGKTLGRRLSGIVAVQ
jgi:hypothetical protein